jgi:glyoxylase-like metal-dependent hydrolase (beta-lactamase superfamily II)
MTPPTSRGPLRAVLVSALLAVSPGAPWPMHELAAQGADVDTPDWETTEIAEGVHQFRWGGHNALLISTPVGMVVVDPLAPAAGTVMAGEIQRLGPGLPLHTIIYSHSDHDHAAGAPALVSAMGQDLASVAIVANERAAPHIEALGDPDLPHPTVTFSERLTIRPGGRAIELHHLGPSHTDNIIVPFLPDVGVAFAVDFVFNDRVGWRDLPGWDFDGLFRAIPGLLEIPFRTIAFGHGAPGDRSTIQRQLTYYDDLAAAVRGAVADGWTEDEAAERIRLPAYEHFADYDAWLPLNVRAVHRWLTAPIRP